MSKPTGSELLTTAPQVTDTPATGATAPRVAEAAQLESDDDAMDDLHRHMFTVLMDRNWSHGVGPAVDITLLARFYERYADHAVAVARQIVYVVTGRMPRPRTV